MKTLLSLIFIAGLTTLAPAAPYIVYSGVATSGDFSALGAVKKATYLYLVTDIADTSSFALMQVDTASKPTTLYTVNSRPSASPTTEETNNNFIGGIKITSGKSGIASFSYSSDTTDSSNNTFISHAYSTGALTLKDVTLVAARKLPLIVKVKTGGVLGTPVTFNPTPAVTTGNTAFPLSLVGTFFNYEIGSAGPLTNVTTQGSFTLAENAILTTLANIGGAYNTGTVATGTTAAIQPIAVSTTAAYSAWLAAFAVQNNYALPATGNSGVFAGP